MFKFLSKSAFIYMLWSKINKNKIKLFNAVVLILFGVLVDHLYVDIANYLQLNYSEHVPVALTIKTVLLITIFFALVYQFKPSSETKGTAIDDSEPKKTNDSSMDKKASESEDVNKMRVKKELRSRGDKIIERNLARKITRGE